MTHEETYQKRRTDGLKKQEKGSPLKPSEKVAIEGKWFFTVPLPIEVIEKILRIAEKHDVRPSQIAEVWIMKGLNGGK